MELKMEKLWKNYGVEKWKKNGKKTLIFFYPNSKYYFFSLNFFV